MQEGQAILLTIVLSVLFSPCLAAPSPVSSVKKGKITKNSISLSWQEPDRPNGIILEYEIKYFEKV